MSKGGVRDRSGPSSGELLRLVRADLDELKAEDVQVLDVRELTDVTDYMVVATGRTGRHVRAITEKVATSAKHRGAPAARRRGRARGREWVLVDLCDVIVHVMQPDARALYQLEKLWSPVTALRRGTFLRTQSNPEPSGPEPRYAAASSGPQPRGEPSGAPRQMTYPSGSRRWSSVIPYQLDSGPFTICRGVTRPRTVSGCRPRK